MPRRVMIWAAAGFLISCCFVIYTFVAPNEQLVVALRTPLGELFAFLSCLPMAVGFVPIHFWWVPPINAASYATIGIIIELFHRKSKPGFAVLN